MDSQCKLCNLSKGEKRWPCSWRSSPGCVSQSVVASSSIMVGRHWLFATTGCWSCWLMACWLACFAPSIVTSPAQPGLWEESGFYLPFQWIVEFLFLVVFKVILFFYALQIYWCVCVCVCLSLSLSLCLSVCLSVSLIVFCCVFVENRSNKIKACTSDHLLIVFLYILILTGKIPEITS